MATTSLNDPNAMRPMPPAPSSLKRATPPGRTNMMNKKRMAGIRGAKRQGPNMGVSIPGWQGFGTGPRQTPVGKRIEPWMGDSGIQAQARRRALPRA